MITVNFTGDINNDSLQIGDMAYYVTPSPLGGFNQSTNDPIFIGPVVDFSQISIPFDPTLVGQAAINQLNLETFLVQTSITIDDVNAQGTIQLDDFLMFAKDSEVNLSGLVGYYAEVYIKNNSTEKAEMFSVGSEITPSSK